jgi:hypothetical protein
VSYNAKVTDIFHEITFKHKNDFFTKNFIKAQTWIASPYSQRQKIQYNNTKNMENFASQNSPFCLCEQSEAIQIKLI